MEKELFVKRLSDNKLFPSAYCTFFLHFKQVLIDTRQEREFVLNESEFEMVYEELVSYKKSYEENNELDNKHFMCYKKLEKEFNSQNPEPDDWSSEEYKLWEKSFTEYLKVGLKSQGFNNVNFDYQ